MNKTKNKILFIVFLGIAILLWVFWSNIFPRFKHTFHFDENNKNRILEKNIAGERFVIFPIDTLRESHYYLFDKVDLKIKFREKIESDIEIASFEGFETLLYPIGPPIENKELLQGFLQFENSSQYPNGSIFDFDQSAFFISKGKALPIFSPDVFVGNGFYWENIISADSDVLSILKEGETLRVHHPHPDGTILRISKEKYFLVWEEKLLPISEELLSETWENFNWADIEKNRPLSGKCQKVVGGKTVSCQFEDNEKRSGMAYIFKISENKNEIEKVKIKTKTSVGKFFKENFRLSLQRIKIKLSEKYGERF